MPAGPVVWSHHEGRPQPVHTPTRGTLLRRTIRAASIGALAIPLAVAAASATSGAAGASPSARSAATPSGRAQISSDRPSYSRSGRIAGSVPDNAPVAFAVDLPLRDAAGAEALAKAVSTPGSASFGKYVTPDAYRARFSPDQSSVDALTSYLRSKQLSVTSVNMARTSLKVTGTALAVYNAFGAYLKTWDAGSAGVLQAPDRALSLPTDVAPLVSGVRGLAQDAAKVTPRSSSDAQPDVPGSSSTASGGSTAPAASSAGPQAPPPPGFINAPPCSTYYGEKLATTLPKYKGQTLPYVPCGYTPQQLRSAYGVDSLINNPQNPIDGRGQTVAIIDAYASPTIARDSATYSANRGLANFAPGQFVQQAPLSPYQFGYNDTVNGDQCGEQGWYGEETLDVEAVHGVAPGAKVLYAPAASCQNIDFAYVLQDIADKHSADIVSNSYGSAGEADDPSTFQAYNNAFIQGQAEGISYLFSSGDSGDESNPPPAELGYRSTDLPASNPNVTAVGGTAIGIGKDGKRLFEQGWGTASGTLAADGKSWTTPVNIYGGGGGTSRVFSQPSYQAGVVPDSLADYFGTGSKHRVVPDVAMIADPQTGFLIGETQTFLNPKNKTKTVTGYGEYRIGGTSLASPAFAGIVAIANQVGGFEHGFLNPSLYALVGTGYVNDTQDPSVTRAVVRLNYGADKATGITDPTTATTPFLRTLNDTQSLHARKGYDDVTGVGEPNGVGFLTHLGSPYGPPSPTPAPTPSTGTANGGPTTG